MKRNWSLTFRLSLIFTCVMMSVWLLSSVVRVVALSNYLYDQDFSLLSGKIELATELLEHEAHTGSSDPALLAERFNDAMVGHSGLYLSVKTSDDKVLIDYASYDFPLPATRFAREARLLDTMQTVEEAGWRYNVLVRKISAEKAERQQDMLITAACDTRLHDEYIRHLKMWLMWFNGALIFISIFLGWVATRIGLRPLNEISRLSSAITVNNLGERLPVDKLPAELMPTVAEFNNMLERLEDSFRRLAEFSSDIAHELRTPVSNMMMQTQVALSRERNAASYRETLFSNLEELGRLARMCNDMLFLAKSENGLMALVKQPVSLRAELEELINFYELLASEDNKSFVLEGEARVTGDCLMLRRAFSNLLTNALRYSPEGAKVQITLRDEADRAYACLTNPTQAMTQEKLSRLFDRFYRTDEARTNSTEGTGLGLSIARSIILAHQGELDVSLSGSLITFTVTLPIAQASQDG
ncbi:two-component sensor histidine kinase (plasmid) [Pantoea alhagi]|uniref:Sensor protein n=1 Tax=Pantoea alhagi TaxID=1891675 RepID=A0A1W6BBB3_9GAMM|nr:heavy metal sensor histidine kinase [Pantoea alhagi]ARJ44415.1 two-component sensor histidine kinase [Pantoea alhagi]